jgi:hypothetical protein
MSQVHSHSSHSGGFGRISSHDGFLLSSALVVNDLQQESVILKELASWLSWLGWMRFT